MDGNLLEIYYDRIKKVNEIILTTSNCERYGYHSTTTQIEVDGEVGTYTVFYKQGEKPKNYLSPDRYENGEAITIHYEYTYKKHSHIAPACSSFKVSFADVDKEGSGRNSLTGEMYRERIGKYIKVDLTWDLIPNTIEYNNWYKVLTHLPPYFNARLLMPSGEIEDKNFYRSDITTDLYLFISNRQMWKGLSTSFIQSNLDEYDDKVEPELEEVTEDGIISNPVFENGDNLAYGD